MSTIVIMPGGFHPFHAGHLSLYNSAQRAFPDAEVFVAATNDTSKRPFPFAIKEKLAQLAGVEPGHFVQVKSPFRAEEITAQFNPEQDRLIFVRSEKDATKPPQAGGNKKDGSPAYLQPLMGAKKLEPFARHAYMAYLPTVEFGPGMTSATEIRAAWPTLNEKRKTALVMSLYPATQTNPQLAATVVKMLDTAIGSEPDVKEAVNPMTANTSGAGAGMKAGYATRENQPPMESHIVGYIQEDPDYIEEKWSQKYKSSINCSNPKGFSQRAHCVGRRKNEDLNEFAPGSDDNRENNPEDVLFRFAKMWYSAPDVATQQRVEQALAKIGWEIGELESEEGGAFVMRIGDDAGDSYIGWPAQELDSQQLDEKCWDTHRQVGMKKKGNRMVPNCVPRESAK